jgi:hypothetical protein
MALAGGAVAVDELSTLSLLFSSRSRGSALQF